MMTSALGMHIHKLISLSDQDVYSVLTFFRSATLKKKEQLLNEGEKCKSLYFIDKGCLRMFYFDKSGNEQTIQLAIENWWMTDLDSFNSGNASEFNIQAIEGTTVSVIEKHQLDELLLSHPAMERYFNQIYQRAYAASLMRIKYIFTLSKEEFYDVFCAKYPAFLQRIPQYILASFLGFTPEYLSELRKKKSLKS
jgi:CRP-like cAMP-binding protein